MQRREDFYRSTSARASSSCSDDSVLGEQIQDHEEWVTGHLGDDTHYFSPDDLISLSLEYYQQHLDKTQEKKAKSDNSEERTKFSASESPGKENENAIKNNGALTGVSANVSCDKTDNVENDGGKEEKVRDRRYLQCPAAVAMSHLQKFLRMKYALSPEHKVRSENLDECKKYLKLFEIPFVSTSLFSYLRTSSAFAIVFALLINECLLCFVTAFLTSFFYYYFVNLLCYQGSSCLLLALL